MLHSRPNYYGTLVALWCAIPAFLIFIVWNIIEPIILKQVVFSYIPIDVFKTLDPASKMVLFDRIQTIASGFGVTDQVQNYETIAAEKICICSSNWCLY